MRTTKRQLQSDVNQLRDLFRRSEDQVSLRDKALKEHNDENTRLNKVLDDVETLNKDLHVKLNAANERIKNLTASIKWLSTSL